MSELNKLISEMCPNGVTFMRIGDIAEVGTGSSNGNEAIDGGLYPFFIRSQTVKTKNAYEYDEEAIIIPGEGGVGEIFHYVDGKYALHQRVYRIHFTKEDILTKFAYYYMQAYFKPFIMKKAVSATVTSIRKPMIQDFSIPIPPLPIQREIVRILDNFTELTAELTARQKQYGFYRDKLLSFSENEVEYLPLGKLYPDIRNGFVGTVTPFFSNKEDGVLYLRGTNVHDGVISDEDIVYVTKDFHEKHNRTELRADDIIMVQSGHVGECAMVGEAYAGANCHALIVMSNGGKCNSKYIVYYFHSREGKKKLNAITTGGTVKHILASKIKRVIVPVPPLEVQDRLVDVLDNFDAICSDLNIGLPAEIEARQKQYEYYRDMLLTFAESGNTISRAERSN